MAHEIKAIRSEFNLKINLNFDYREKELVEEMKLLYNKDSLNSLHT